MGILRIIGKGPQLISTKVLQLRLHQLKVQNAFHSKPTFPSPPPPYLIPVKSPTEDQLARCLETKSTRTKYSKKKNLEGEKPTRNVECRSSPAPVEGWLTEPNQCDAGREDKPAPGSGSRCPWSQEASHRSRRRTVFAKRPKEPEGARRAGLRWRATAEAACRGDPGAPAGGRARGRPGSPKPCRDCRGSSGRPRAPITPRAGQTREPNAGQATRAPRARPKAPAGRCGSRAADGALAAARTAPTQWGCGRLAGQAARSPPAPPRRSPPRAPLPCRSSAPLAASSASAGR